MTKSSKLHAKLKELRRSRGMTLHNLADKIGEDHQKIGRIERGKKALTVDYLMKLSNALDTPVEALLKTQHSHTNSTQVSKEIYLEHLILSIEELTSEQGVQMTAKQKALLTSKLLDVVCQLPVDSCKSVVAIFLELLTSF